MFFVLSKTVGLLADPVGLSIFLALVVLVLRHCKRAPKLRRRLLVGAGLMLLTLSLGSVASALLSPLESAHPRPRVLPSKVGALVILTGMLTDGVATPAPYEFNQAADRFVEGVRLAHVHPEATLIVSGGSGRLTGGGLLEGAVLARLATEMGVAKERVRYETHSRNTRENATESKKLLVGIDGPVVLITSAVHMPRSVGCFNRAGVKVIAWPVDFMKTGYGLGTWLPQIWSLERSRTAIKEYVGLLAYRLSGYL